MNTAWKQGEYQYCYALVQSRGNLAVGHEPKAIATYLRLQACDAFRANEFELCARLNTAATAINEDARNDHEPNWARAIAILGELRQNFQLQSSTRWPREPY